MSTKQGIVSLIDDRIERIRHIKYSDVREMKMNVVKNRPSGRYAARSFLCKSYHRNFFNSPTVSVTFTRDGVEHELPRPGDRALQRTPIRHDINDQPVAWFRSGLVVGVHDDMTHIVWEQWFPALIAASEEVSP